MTCIVPSYVSDDHVHFLDGAGGGYALAAQALKEKLSARKPVSARTQRVKRARRLRLGLSTLLGFGKRGFFIPYRYADQVPARKDRASYEALEPIFAEAAETFAALLRSMTGYAEAFQRDRRRRRRSRAGSRTGFRASTPPRSTSSCARRSRARIVEVGSGPLDALHGARRPRRRARDRDHFDRSGSARRHRRDRRNPHPQHGARRRALAVRGACRRRHPLHRFKPHPDAGHRRGHALQPRPPGAEARRASCTCTTFFCPTTIRPNGNGAATTSSSASRR